MIERSAQCLSTILFSEKSSPHESDLATITYRTEINLILDIMHGYGNPKINGIRRQNPLKKDMSVLSGGVNR